MADDPYDKKALRNAWETRGSAMPEGCRVLQLRAIQFALEGIVIRNEARSRSAKRHASLHDGNDLAEYAVCDMLEWLRRGQNKMIGETRNPQDVAQTRSFLHDLRDANPAGAELLDRHAAKAGIARALRAMRAARHMTQKEVSLVSGLTQPRISRLESPTGPMPALNSVMRYVSACGGHLSLAFQLDQPVTAGDVKPHCSVASLV